MKNLIILFAVLFVVNASCVQPSVAGEPAVIDEAFTHKNLTMFLIQGGDLVEREYVALEQAMERKLIMLRETGDVGELQVDNLSDEYIFIMSGDIVKGGKQDRTISEDVILKPKAKKVPLKSFCVEQGRWQQRGLEEVGVFSSSSNMLSNRNLKVAARSSKSQGKVWSEVSEFQRSAGDRVRSDIQSSSSATSLQLSLENKEFKKNADEYIEELERACSKYNNIVGFAFCINGKVSTVEWFGNAGLASQISSKLFESLAGEAIFASSEEGYSECTANDVRDFIAGADKGDETSESSGDDILTRKRETDNSIQFKTFNLSAGDHPVHVSIYSTEDINMDSGPQMQFGGYRNINR